MTMAAKTIPIRSTSAPSQAFEYISTKKDELVGWARKFSLFPYPFVTACCAMEFMAVSSSPYDTDRFGAALPRFSPRQCATSGGFYQNYATLLGIDKIIPVDIYVPGCPPRPETVIDAIMKLQDRIANSPHPIVNENF